MKLIILIVLMIATVDFAFAQGVSVETPRPPRHPNHARTKAGKEELSGEYKLKVGGNHEGKRLVISINNSDLEIIGSDGDEIVFQAYGLSKIPERADGLKPISNLAADNSGVGLAITVDGTSYKVTKATKEDIRYIIKVPKKMALSLNEIHWGGNGIKISEISGEVEINSKSSDVQLKNVAGPIIANSTGGNILIVYTTLTPGKPNSISVVGGFVDITMPANTKANLNLNTMGGEIYSDLEIKMADKEGKSAEIVFPGGSKVQASLNGGGTDLNINAMGGDIYLRKQK